MKKQAKGIWIAGLASLTLVSALASAALLNLKRTDFVLPETSVWEDPLLPPVDGDVLAASRQRPGLEPGLTGTSRPAPPLTASAAGSGRKDSRTAPIAPSDDALWQAGPAGGKAAAAPARSGSGTTFASLGTPGATLAAELAWAGQQPLSAPRRNDAAPSAESDAGEEADGETEGPGQRALDRSRPGASESQTTRQEDENPGSDDHQPAASEDDPLLASLTASAGEPSLATSLLPGERGLTTRAVAEPRGLALMLVSLAALGLARRRTA